MILHQVGAAVREAVLCPIAPGAALGAPASQTVGTSSPKE